MLKAGVQERRRDARTAVKVPADLRSPLQPYGPVAVLDLSRTGVRLEGCGLCDVRVRTLIRLPTLATLPITMVWHRHDQYGFRFERPLHPAVLDLLVARHGDAKIGKVGALIC